MTLDFYSRSVKTELEHLAKARFDAAYEALHLGIQILKFWTCFHKREKINLVALFNVLNFPRLFFQI